MMPLVARASFFMVFAISSFLLIGCNRRSNEESAHLSDADKFKELLNVIVEESATEIQRLNTEFVRENGKEKEFRGGEITILPTRVELADSGVGLVWERMLYAKLDEEQVEAMKVLYSDPWDSLEGYCKPPVLDWMKDYDYFVIEKLFARGRIPINETRIDYQRCLEYLEFISDYNSDVGPFSSDESNDLKGVAKAAKKAKEMLLNQ
jgi:hypothetical protein